MRSLFSIRSLLWPSLAAMVFAGFFIITQPGPLYADAAEYDAIARSILQGRFELVEEFTPNVLQPTMHREPGYPAFRAAIYTIVGDHPKVILWVQALLAALTVALTGLTLRRLDARWALPAAWLLALYPGFTVWTCQHYSEILAAFLVSCAAFAWVRMLEVGDDRTRKALVLAGVTGVAIGILTLVKASFQLLPVFAFVYLLVLGPWKFRWKQALLVLGGFLLIVTPWIVRNQRQFGVPAITYRTGIVIYTRALNAQASWAQLATSYGSALIGEATMLRLFPSAPPIIIQRWQETWIAKNTLLKEGLRFYQADAILLTRGKDMIFSSPSVFTRYVLWSGINELRLFSLTSPLSPKFSVEWIANDKAKVGPLSWSQWGIVLAANLIQFVWWALLLLGSIVIVRTRLWRHPAVLFLGYTIIMYAPFDNIPRYAVPLLPLMIAVMVTSVISPAKQQGSRACVPPQI